MNDQIDPLLAALGKLTELLAEHSESHWAEWIMSDANLIRSGDRGGVEHFLSAFGGMGSLNVLVFDPINGNAATADAATLINQRFLELKSEAYRLASSLRPDA